MQTSSARSHRRSACSGVKALRNTSAARRQAAKLCYRFGPLTPSARSANLIAGDGDEERLSRSELKTANKPKDHLTGKAPYKPHTGSNPPPTSGESRKPLVPARVVLGLARRATSPMRVGAPTRFLKQDGNISKCPHSEILLVGPSWLTRRIAVVDVIDFVKRVHGLAALIRHELRCPEKRAASDARTQSDRVVLIVGWVGGNPRILSALNKGTTIPSSLFSPSFGGQQHRLFSTSVTQAQHWRDR